MAHVKKMTTTKGTRYDVRWRLANGAFRQKRFTSAKQARDFLATVTLTPVDTKAGKVTFKEVVDDLLDNPPRPLKATTVAKYRQEIDCYIAPTFGHRRIDSITTRDVTVWQQGLAKMGSRRDILASATQRRALITMGKVMRHALRTGLIQTNPMAGIVLPPMNLRGHEPMFLTPAEVEKLALAVEQRDELATASGQTSPFGDLVRFAAWTGVRAGELAGLQVGDVDLKRGVVAVRRTLRKVKQGWLVDTPKSQRSNREVPLAPNVVAILERHLATHPRRDESSAPLWPGRVFGGDHHGELDWNKPLHMDPFYRRHYKPATVACGFDGLRFHDLRHTFASLCAEAGVPMVKVSRWLGHGSIMTTDTIYAHLYADHTADLAKLARLAE